jgi:hypothetical protein
VESAFDVSLERYEYAAPSAILSDEGATGFVVTCAFNREKSATKEALELLRPHLPHLPVAAPHGLRLNPVKMPGRGVIFVRLSARPAPAGIEAVAMGEGMEPGAESGTAPGAAAAEAEHKDADEGGEANETAKSKVGAGPGAGVVRTEAGAADKDTIWVGGVDSAAAAAAAVSSAVVGVAAAVVAAVRCGTAPQPRWVEKLQPVQLTCKPDSDSIRAALRRAVADSGVVVGGGGVTFAVVYTNRFKGETSGGGGKDGGGNGGGGDGGGGEGVVGGVANGGDGGDGNEYSRAVVIPRVAAGVEASSRKEGDDIAGGGGAEASTSFRVNLKDPDLVVFVEVLSVPAPTGGGRFSQRLTIGVLPKSAGVFEVKKKGIAPLALKAAAGVAAAGAGGGGKNTEGSKASSKNAHRRDHKAQSTTFRDAPCGSQGNTLPDQS